MKHAVQRILLVASVFCSAAGAAFCLRPADAPVVVGAPSAPVEPQAAKPSPQEAWQKTRAEKNAVDRCLARLRMAAGASVADCRRLYQLGVDENDSALQFAVAQRWAETNPADFWKWMAGLSEREVELSKPNLIYSQIILLRLWARNDPDAAIAAVMQAAPRFHLSAARGEVFNSLLSTDPARAFSMAARLTKMTIVDRIDPAVYASDPGRFVRAADQLPRGSVRNWIKEQALYDAVNLWHAKEPDAALAWILKRNTDEQCMFLPKVTEQLLKKDFAAGLKLLEKIPPSSQREGAGMEVVKIWAKTDPAAALAWAEANFQGRKLQGFNSIIDGAMETGADHAAAFAAAVAPGNGRDRAVSRVAWRWAEKDADAAMSWVTSLPPDSARRAAFAAIGGNWVAQHPDKAAAWITASPAAEIPDFLVHRTARQLAVTQPQEALTWAVQVPEEHRITAMRGAVGQLVWLRPQPEFAPLLAQLTPPQQDLAVNSMVDNWAYSCEGPKPAWVNTLTPVQRAHARERIEQYSFLDAEDRANLRKALE
jgi:hypothetical protein